MATKKPTAVKTKPIAKTAEKTKKAPAKKCTCNCGCQSKKK